MSFSRSDVSAKKHMARVSDLYRERVRTIKTVLFFIVSVSVFCLEKQFRQALCNNWSCDQLSLLKIRKQFVLVK